MFQKLSLVFLILLSAFIGKSQITTDPEFPVASTKVIITFDSSKESRLGYYTGDLYAHTGVITSSSANSDDWKYVIENWGNNTTQPKLTNKGSGIYELELSPDAYSFYGVPANEKILQLAFVFRTSDSNNQTNNLYVDVFEEGLAVTITQPAGSSIFTVNQTTIITASSSTEADLKLFLGESLISETTESVITAEYTFTEEGYHWLIAEASANGETVTDSMRIFVRNEVITESKPSSYKKGINYIDNNMAALVLWAPGKEFVFVIGDFNNWEVNSNYQMKKDGDYFWLEIPNLVKGEEYAFQYFIDGEIKIADPYTEKILDPWNDQYITSTIYPDLLAYPSGKTEGIAAVLQTGQEPYNWQVNDFQAPENSKLVIYELLVRDFTTGQSLQGVIDQLDYLEDLRINVLELMPVNEFEGNNSWGYNPSFYFAPDKAYGPKNKLKELIDECHQRGIAVVIDMVLNHSYGQSPFVQMYMDNWTITPDNPWYNQQSNFQNTSLQWGYDFNHESAATRELVDSVASFWMSEYKVDGYRFDFTKGFSNTAYGSSSWGSEYDAARVANLKRMSTEIWKRNPDALVIFEHLADNSEETELANSGIMLWGNMHGSFLEAARGNYGSSDLNWSVYKQRGWNNANLVSYPESHDEERIVYEIKRTGFATDVYNIKNQTTALKRIELNSLFHLPLPGPKMIWQFGERGYDLSINRCTDGTISNDCRLSPKPPYWQYLDNSDRTDLFQVMAKLNELKQTYEEFTPESFTYNLSGAVKSYTLINGDNAVLAFGNFDVISQNTNVEFTQTGKWYEFFTRDSIEVTTAIQNLSLQPGEYRLYSTRKFDDPHVITDIQESLIQDRDLTIYPNPVSDQAVIKSGKMIRAIEMYSMEGKLVNRKLNINDLDINLNVADLNPGIYILRTILDSEIITQKIVKK